MNLPRVRNFNFGICIFGTGMAFPNPSLRSFEVFHGLKRSTQDFHAIGKTCLKHTFLYDLGMARLVVTFPDRFFFVDCEKQLKCIDICIYTTHTPHRKNRRPFLRVPNPRREHHQHRACFWSHIWNWPASGIRNLAFLYFAAAVFKVSCEINKPAIQKLTVDAALRHWQRLHMLRIFYGRGRRIFWPCKTL